MKKRLLSLITTVCIFGSIMTPCFAVSPQQEEQPITQEALNAEIEDRLEIVMADVYRQLEEQDALVLLDVYKDLMRSQVTQSIYYKYNIPLTINNGIEATPAANGSHRADYGAVSHYFAPMPYGYEPTELTTVYFDQDRTEAYLLKDEEFIMSMILDAALDNVWSKIFGATVAAQISALTSIPTIVELSIRANIEAADRKAMIIYSYSHEFDTSATVTTGWESYPIIVEPGDAIDYEIVDLPPYNGSN